MSSRPVLFVLAPSTGTDVRSEVFDVRTVGTSDATSVIEQIAEARGTRWLLLMEPGAESAGADVVALALTGRAPVFGLSGVMTRGAWTGDPAVPRRVVTEGESAVEAAERFWQEHAGRGPRIPSDVLALLASNRVSERTRGIHARRALADDPQYRPSVLTPGALEVLRVVADVVVPQGGGPGDRHDLGARDDAQLAAGRGDRWRPAGLPADPEAYRLALHEVADLVELSPGGRESALAEVAEERRVLRTSVLTSEQLTAWFEDARNDLVRQWLAHPASLSRVGFDGYATGGPQLLGFADPASPGREAWEPALAEARRGGVA